MAEEAAIALVRDSAAWAAMEPEWIRLWASDPSATPFQRPEWLMPWWHAFGTAELRVVTLRRKGELVGMLPMYVYREPATGERQLLLVGAGTTDYLGGVFSPGVPQREIVRAIEVLRAEEGWDVAYLTQLRPGSLLAGMLSAMPTERVRRFPGESCSRCPAVAVAELPTKVRSAFRYFRNAAISHGRLALRAAGPDEWQEIFDVLVRQHTERWERQGEAGVLAAPEVLACHREAIPRLQASGLLRLTGLFLDGEPVAALYSLIDPPGRTGRTQYFYLMGHSLAHEELRPGVLLLGLAIEAAAAEGVQTIDMLRGEETYKQFWHATPEPTAGFAIPRG